MKIALNGRIAAVTGSTAGIGRAIAEGLARAGALVVVNGRGNERVSTAVHELPSGSSSSNSTLRRS